MKIPFYIVRCAIGLAFCSVLLSCSLDEDPRDQRSQESAYLNRDALVRNAVATLYTHIGGTKDGEGLQGTCRGIYDLQTFGSDEAMVPTRGIDWYDGGRWQELYTHKWKSSNPFIYNAWAYLYNVIALCNRSVEILEQNRALIGDLECITLTAEVRALRAIFYWQLLDLFGRVPIVTTTDVDIVHMRQSSRLEVFNFVERELVYAYTHLPYGESAHIGDHYGRVTADVVCFVLAKLMLNAEVYSGTPRWQDCINYCNQLEEMGYSLASNYQANFDVHNENSPENIWVIPMNKTLYTNQQQNIIRSLHYRHAALYAYKGENGACATLKTLQVFNYNTNDEDWRFHINYWGDYVNIGGGEMLKDKTGALFRYWPEQVQLDLSGSPYVETAGARMSKYTPDLDAMNDGKLIENDIVLFRYADVLLMRAEAKLRSGQDGQSDFDLVRTRSYMSPRPITLQNLLDERLLELCWEGWRRQDLIRFGQYKSLYTGPGAVDESDGHTTVFPIPDQAMATNPALTQNKGYK